MSLLFSLSAREPIRARLCLAVLAFTLCAGGAAIAADAPHARWQCAPTGGSTLLPALAEAASDYLGRVEAIYPYRVLGLVRAADRFYLMNSGDVDWGERTRLNLLALRLRESYLAAERQAAGAVPGAAPPPGGFVCLAAGRAEREGLTRTPLGEIVLAAGQSLHLVDPQEPQVAVEVRAGPDRPLNLGDIFHRSARTGIYAGLTAKTAGHARQQGSAATVAAPGGTFIFRVASAGTAAVETRIDVGGTAAPNVLAAVPKQAAEPVATGPAALKPAKVTPASPADTGEPGTIPAQRPAVASVGESVAGSGVMVAAISASAVPADVPIPAVTGPRLDRPTAPPPARGAEAQASRSAGEQSYEDYAKIMKKLMALRRSGGVRSISEMTYVHPAVELIRSQNP